jgi:hypothetical protein
VSTGYRSPLQDTLPYGLMVPSYHSNHSVNPKPILMKTRKFSRGLVVLSLAVIAIFAAGSCNQEEIRPEGNPVTLKAGSLFAEVTVSNGTWRAVNSGTTVYTGSDMFAAVNAAIASLPSGRTSKGTVSIKNSGSSGPSGGSIKAINIQSYTILNFNGTQINCNSGDLLIVPVQGDRKSNIEILNLRVNGNPRYGIWLKGCSNINIQGVSMTLTAGLGIRVDHSTGATRNLTLGATTINGSTATTHAVETYGLDGFNIGNITANTSGGCGVLLNQSRNGSVGTVNGYRCNKGGGYAAFRVANNNGPNVTCTKVYARECGRGFFSVTGSNGTTVNTVDIANGTSHGIFLEDASNTRVNAGTVSNCNPNIQHVRTSSCRTAVNGQVYTAADGRW